MYVFNPQSKGVGMYYVEERVRLCVCVCVCVNMFDSPILIWIFYIERHFGYVRLVSDKQYFFVSGWNFLMEPLCLQGRTKGTVRLFLTKNRTVFVVDPCVRGEGIAEAFVATRQAVKFFSSSKSLTYTSVIVKLKSICKIV